MPVGPNADLAILGAAFDFTELGERLRQQVLQYLRQSIKQVPYEHTFTVNDAAVPHRDEPTGDGDDDLAIDNDMGASLPETANRSGRGGQNYYVETSSQCLSRRNPSIIHTTEPYCGRWAAPWGGAPSTACV